jgi:hypothetical protein
MPIFSRLIFTVVHWSARRGLRDSPAECYRNKMKKCSGMRNSSARKKRVAEACSERLMATGTSAGRDTFLLPKIICRKAPRASWIWWDTTNPDAHCAWRSFWAARAERQLCKAKRAGAYRTTLLSGSTSERLSYALRCAGHRQYSRSSAGNQAAQRRLQPAIPPLQIIFSSFVALNGDTIRSAGLRRHVSTHWRNRGTIYQLR